jgi:hypothetical protein
MNLEQKVRLTEKRWLTLAKQIRPAIARSIANALSKDGSQIVFTDFTLTKELSELFAQQVGACEAVEAKDRATALEMVAGALEELPNALFLLPNRFDDCGMVSIEVSDLKDHLDGLLSSQYEALQLISPDGKAGVCLTTQEAALPFSPRCVNIWYYGSQNHPQPDFLASPSA